MQVENVVYWSEMVSSFRPNDEKSLGFYTSALKKLPKKKQNIKMKIYKIISVQKYISNCKIFVD